MKDFEFYHPEGTPDSEEYIKEIEKVRAQQESKINILKDEIRKLVETNENLENDIQKMNSETSEEEKESELQRQRKEISDLQDEIQNMEEKIREGQEELANLDMG
eukprot:CAMPEP_0197012268 /NCGR_PEP_ID=MMETSP1380-20130617/61877_1 /TAXON_ID=5936 /ORGANISM="Euplotes crassus, Strain CT5" /LENGTH=104 /DNA_ID=CAMNT_0042435617 /DNA_START=136 /DNA_END=447 /DNA_ORIENTATION=-